MLIVTRSAFSRRCTVARYPAPLLWLRNQSSKGTGSTAPAASPQPALSEGEQVIHSKLKQRFTPSELLVQDVSGGCGAFYAITIASQAFTGLSTIKQHKLVTETLKKEIEGIHGLQIKTIPQ